MQWSSVSDSPSSPLLPEPLFKKFWYAEYGRSGWLDYARDIDRADSHGCSAMGYTAERVISGNRAGKNEKRLTKAQLIKAFTCETEAEFAEWTKMREEFVLQMVEDFGPKKST